MNVRPLSRVHIVFRSDPGTAAGSAGRSARMRRGVPPSHQPERLRPEPPRARRLRHAYRTSVRPVWRELRPLVIVLCGLLVVVLGTIGYLELPSALSFLDALSRSFGLFGLGGAVAPPVPWQL